MATARLPEIDWLKGFAILCVIVNHSGALNGTWLYDHVVARAVPVLLVLFGMNAELWWSKRAGDATSSRIGEWYTSRFRRLMIPFWSALTLWWVLVFLYSQNIPRTTSFILASYAGYVPWVRTYWFVTLILECVAAYPAIRWAMIRLGEVPSVLVALLATVTSAFCYLNVLHWGDILLRSSSPNPHSYFWIFLPAYLWHIVAGAMLARRPALRGPAAGIVATIAYLAIAWTASRFGPGTHALMAQLVGDVPLAVALLVGMRAFSFWPAAAALLAWCGGASWGLYLGHILAYEGFHMFGFQPELSSIVNRWMFAGALLTSGVGVVALGQALRQTRIGDWVPSLRR